MLDIQFEHDRSQGILGILGSSGCGKSMTLRCISGVVRPDSGRITLGDEVFYSSKDRIFIKPRNRGVGHLFQDYALFPNMTVRNNILAGMRGDKKENLTRIDQLLHSFYILDQANKYPGELSGGQKQRAALARAFASKPSILLLDEPFSALDEYLRYQLEQNLFEYLEQYEGIVLYVSHNRDEIRRFCDHVLVVEDGQAISYMPVINLFDSPWHFPSARLAGVRNFSHAEKRGTYTVFAHEWNTLLSTTCPVPDDLEYIGVRETSVRILQRVDGDISTAIPTGNEEATPTQNEAATASRSKAAISAGNKAVFPKQNETAFPTGKEVAPSPDYINTFKATVLRIVSGITSDTVVLLPSAEDSEELFSKIFVTIDKSHDPLHPGDRVLVAIAADDIMCLK